MDEPGYPDSEKALDMIATRTAELIAEAEAAAVAPMPPTIAIEHAAIDQYAIHDPESADWVFTNFD